MDWFASILVAGAIVGPGVMSSRGWEAWMPLLVFLVEGSVLTPLVGGSFGQLLLRVAVVRLDRRPVNLLVAVLRTLLICLVVPPVIYNRDRRGLHDLVAGRSPSGAESALDADLRHVEVAGAEAGLAVGQVELPHPAEPVVEAERLHALPFHELLAPQPQRVRVVQPHRADVGDVQRGVLAGDLAIASVEGSIPPGKMYLWIQV